MKNWMDKKIGLRNEYRVNVISKKTGKEIFRYFISLKKAREAQLNAIDNALCSNIAQKINGKYTSI